MANNLSRVTVSGRLTKTPELMSTQNGAHTITVTIASNYYGGEKNPEAVSFFTVRAFSKTAEFISRYFGKGDEIYVDGQLREDRWEKDGQKRSLVYVLAENVYFGAKKKGSDTKESTATTELTQDTEFIETDEEDLPF